MDRRDGRRKYGPEAYSNWKRSTRAMFRLEFCRMAFLMQLLLLIVIFSVVIMQQGLIVLFMLAIPQPILNYSNVSSIYSKIMPLKTQCNTLTPFNVSTATLFDLYISDQDAHENQIELNCTHFPTYANATVNETLTSFALYINKTSEIRIKENAPRNMSLSSMGAYYIYNMDESANDYSVAVYGNQASAASLPTYGATMLETIAQKITGKKALQIDFK